MGEIGRKIRTFRNEAGISQSELARESGMSRSAICRYEAGEREPGLDILQQIADALNIPVTEFILDHSEIELKKQLEEQIEDAEDELLSLVQNPLWKRLVESFGQLNVRGQREIVWRAEEYATMDCYRISKSDNEEDNHGSY